MLLENTLSQRARMVREYPGNAGYVCWFESSRWLFVFLNFNLYYYIMTREECMSIIRKRIVKYENDRIKDNERTNQSGYVSNDSWYEGVKRGLKDALEIVGMIDKPNKI